jgi:lysozyme
MKLSPAGRAFLEQQEGVVLRVYRDVSGIPTVGCGHVVLPEDGLSVGDEITQAQCDAFLAHDVAKCEAAIERYVKPALSQNAFNALCSLIFNIGVSGFESSTVVRVINGSTEMPLEQAWELWDKDVQGGAKVTDQGLLARRKLEVALYLTPDATEVA